MIIRINRTIGGIIYPVKQISLLVIHLKSFQEFQIFILEALLAMMCFLIGYVMVHPINM